ncbi:17057_t:CDS:2 [Cetraspora pellucida]|uniref:17057_t:CDS:1 n=1 Tax=Cetraspora pellucida TaxID=1433469 RepID=A0A9N9FJ15_9GLOM|nr:17057_t:CDS:2 [Cetraspora pellucida]
MLHDDLDVWIKGQLASFAYSELPKQKKKIQDPNNIITRDRFNYQYRYDAQHIVCLSTYLKLIGISSSRLDRIKTHIKDYGMAKPIHGNMGRPSIRSDHAIINEQVKQELNNYIRNYATFYGLPLPIRHLRNDAMSIILLPINTTYNSIYEEYISTIKSIKGENYKIMAYTTFLKIWKEVASDIRFMTKASDLCDTYHVEAAVNESKKDGSNIAVRYDKSGWNYYDFEKFLEPYFIKCNGIRQFRHFYFYHDQPDKIYMTLESNGPKIEAVIRNSVYFDPYQSLSIIPIKPLSLKRQIQLFKDIRPYVHDPYKDELCFAPNKCEENLLHKSLNESMDESLMNGQVGGRSSYMS